MYLKKFLSLLVLIGLFLIPAGELGGAQIVTAQDDPPPPQEIEGRLDQDAADPDLVPGTTITEDLDMMTYMTGTDPNPGALRGSELVEVIIPASEPPDARAGESLVPYEPRPETSYLIEQKERLVPGPDVLLLEADNDTPTSSPILSLLQMYGDMGEVDMFDAQTGTPTLSQLLPYDVVVIYNNFNYANPVAIGNVLANYVDAGGRVINLVGSFGTHGYQMQGRFMTQNYTAMNGTDVLYATQCMDSSNPSHPILFGITAVCSDIRVKGTTLTSESSSIAQWEDGLLFVAAKNDRSVVTINAFVGGGSIHWTGQLPDVLHNAILWLVDDAGECNTVLHSNGPLVTHIGGGFSGANASVLQTALGMNTYGFGHQFINGYRMADDFTVTSPGGWQVEQLTFYAYQSGTYTFPPASTITGVYYQIWDGPPDNPASQVIFGDLTTNRLLESSWTHTYRVVDYDMMGNQRPIMANVASAGVFLPQGTYWLDWMTDGSLTSGPWAPPITILGMTTTGNALQYVTAWGPAQDTGTLTQQGMPFLVQGCKEETAWEEVNSNPVHLMDNVLAAYKGKIWSITGYGDSDGVSTYNPGNGVWKTIPSSAPPFGINYAHSGCQVGGKVFMYGDTSTAGFTGLWRYNMDANTWTSLTPGNPGFAPPAAGVWAPAWVLDSATNRCYLTGGATASGGGDLNTVYVYDVGSNKWLHPLPNFTTPRNFHAAYLFTRPSDGHKLLCVVGGYQIAVGGLKSTQCYDFATTGWRPQNSDIGALPMKIWGHAYAQTPTVNSLNLWLINGVNASGGLNNQTWVIDLQNGTMTAVGPLESDSFYRTSAVTLNGNIYHVGGARGGFNYSGLSDRYISPLSYIFLPFIVK